MSSSATGPFSRMPFQDHDSGLGHIAPVSIYIKVYAALVAFTALTIGAAKLELGVLTLTIALAIATTKAALVGLYFMHLKWEGKIIWTVALYPLFVFLLLLGGTLGDYFEISEPEPMYRQPRQEWPGALPTESEKTEHPKAP